ncbi:putative SWI/SNF-related matrix-associated actin-dependent regulator of chromatin [Pseudocercospora fuligena]|uniref:Putative SWI/SNF-related matrix-associated actin-dependent regulator of chromatin n=1 Tax=Pseudocercospora fuligena TaxID=685502 RepID=A0A8H6R5E4_9PEZI|nr:putative SWI/SNF-related matrix-associated actin-dependent regulator of chromatin [Pseudocercospora fuligena]
MGTSTLDNAPADAVDNSWKTDTGAGGDAGGWQADGDTGGDNKDGVFSADNVSKHADGPHHDFGRFFGTICGRVADSASRPSMSDSSTRSDPIRVSHTASTGMGNAQAPRGSRVWAELDCLWQRNRSSGEAQDASRVVIIEPFWDPFVEEQAIDRVHRPNQTLDVKVFRLIIRGSVEERILELQEKERELANTTIEGSAKGMGNLSMKETLGLFKHDAENMGHANDREYWAKFGDDHSWKWCIESRAQQIKFLLPSNRMYPTFSTCNLSLLAEGTTSEI